MEVVFHVDAAVDENPVLSETHSFRYDLIIRRCKVLFLPRKGDRVDFQPLKKTGDESQDNPTLNEVRTWRVEDLIFTIGETCAYVQVWLEPALQSEMQYLIEKCGWAEYSGDEEFFI